MERSNEEDFFDQLREEKHEGEFCFKTMLVAFAIVLILLSLWLGN